MENLSMFCVCPNIAALMYPSCFRNRLKSFEHSLGTWPTISSLNKDHSNGIFIMCIIFCSILQTRLSPMLYLQMLWNKWSPTTLSKLPVRMGSSRCSIGSTLDFRHPDRAIDPVSGVYVIQKFASLTQVAPQPKYSLISAKLGLKEQSSILHASHVSDLHDSG